METQSPFDLNLAVQQWREQLAASPAFRGENLDELEAHLRDSVARLEGGGLSAEEAWIIAMRRMGSHERLEFEFTKINRQSLWLDRFLWIVVVFQGWSVLGAISIFITNLFSGIAYRVSGAPLSSWNSFQQMAVIAQWVLPLLMAIGLWAWFFSKPDNKLGRRLALLLNRPTALSFGLLAISLVIQTAGPWTLHGWIYPQLLDLRASPFSGFHNAVVLHPHQLILAGLTLFIPRKRLRLQNA